MKIAVTASGEGWDAPIDERFGRARCFAIITIEGDQRSLDNIDNTQNLQAAQGAGIQAAEAIHRSGATKLMTGHVGPKAFRALNAGRVEIYSGVRGTVLQAVEDFLAGRLTPTKGADVEGHW